MDSNFDASRRWFLLGFGAMAGVGSIHSAPAVQAAFCETGPVITYAGRRRCIEVFEKSKAGWQKKQVCPSACPSSLVLDKEQRRLFVVNEVAEYEGLPSGSVESYSVQAGSGKLELIGRQPLSLSGTLPRHLALAPDGRAVVVAVYGGGAYNVLPVAADGELGHVSQVFKEIGSGVHPEKQRTAHPHSVVFHPGGRFLIATDFGSDRLHVFRYVEGRLERVQTMATAMGSGPSHLTIHPSGKLIYVAHELKAELSCYSFRAVSGEATYKGTCRMPAVVTGLRASARGVETSFSPSVPVAWLQA